MQTARRNAKTRMLTLAAAAGLAFAGITLSGCATYNAESSSGTSGSQLAGSQGPAASPVQHPMLEGIPIPVGFRMVPERSVARESGRLRVAQCEFEGRAQPEQVQRFYLNYMPTAHFTLRQRRLDNGEYKLQFESDTEECSVYIKPNQRSTALVIDLGPLAKGSTERQPLAPVSRPQ